MPHTTNYKRLAFLCSGRINFGYLEGFFLVSSDLAKYYFYCVAKAVSEIHGTEGRNKYNHYL